MMKDKVILTGLFVLMFSMALLVGCGTTNESKEGNQVESESQLPGDRNSELDENETGTEDVSETETGTDEGVSTEGTEDVEQDTSADTELDAIDTEKEESNSDKNEGTTDNKNNPSNNLSGGINSGNNTDSNSGTPSAGNNTGNSGNTNNNSGNTTTNNSSGDSNTGSSGSANTNTNTGTDNGSTDTENDKGSNDTDNNDSTPSTPVPQTSKEAFDLINEERVKLGLEPAVWDEECERIALIRAQEIYDLGSKISSEAHDGFDKFWWENVYLSECVAWGYTTPDSVVSAWMNSDGHRGALMAEHYTKLAVARCGGRWVAVNCLVVE